MILVILVGTSKSFQDCIHERKNHDAYQALHEEHSLFVKAVVRLGLHAACVRYSAGENDAAIGALATIAIALFTLTLWKETNRLWRSAESELDALREANELSRQSLAAGQRAWLRPEICKINGLIYKPKNSAPLFISFSISVKNIGNSPATRVYLGKRIILQHTTERAPRDIRPFQIELAAKTKERVVTTSETVIFPGDSDTERWAIPIFKSRFTEMEAELTTKKSEGDSNDSIHRGYAVIPTLIGCIDYEFPFSTGRHQTWFAYEITLREGHTIILRENEIIRAENLTMREAWACMKYAD